MINPNHDNFDSKSSLSEFSQNDLTVSTDLEKDSHDSLCEEDKRFLSNSYPNQIISHKQFNEIFSVKSTYSPTQTDPSLDIPINCDLRSCDDQTKKEKRVKRLNIKREKEFLKQDLANRLKALSSKTLAGEQEQEFDNFILKKYMSLADNQDAHGEQTTRRSRLDSFKNKGVNKSLEINPYMEQPKHETKKLPDPLKKEIENFKYQQNQTSQEELDKNIIHKKQTSLDSKNELTKTFKKTNSYPQDELKSDFAKSIQSPSKSKVNELIRNFDKKQSPQEKMQQVKSNQTKITKVQEPLSPWKKETIFQLPNSNELNLFTNTTCLLEQNTCDFEKSFTDKKEIDNFKNNEKIIESSLLKRRKAPTLKNIQIPQIEDEPMPEELKLESPHKRFQDCPELPLDRFSDYISNLNKIPQAIQTAPANMQHCKNNETGERVSQVIQSAPIESKNYEYDEIDLSYDLENWNSLDFEKDTIAETDSIKEKVIKTREMIRMIVTKNLTHLLIGMQNPFNELELSTRASTLCKIIHREMKRLNREKSKILVNVIIGHICEDSVKFGSKSFWNKNKDYYTSYVYIDEFIYCIVNAFTVAY